MKELLTFETDPEKCPYLDGRVSRLRSRILVQMSPLDYSRMLAGGWRRFGCNVFRPVCPDCEDCIPLRLPVDRFVPSRSQRRVLRRNADLELEVAEPAVDGERLALYDRHHRERAASRGWPTPRMTPEEYRDTFVYNAAPTLELRLRLDGRLVSIGYVGIGADALNAIYTFTDPDLRSRSLGTLNVLHMVQTARRSGKRYVYLGYWIEGCGSMAYKDRFKPNELRVGGVWRSGEIEQRLQQEQEQQRREQKQQE